MEDFGFKACGSKSEESGPDRYIVKSSLLCLYCLFYIFVGLFCQCVVDSFGVLYVQGVSFALPSCFVGRFMVLYYFRL